MTEIPDIPIACDLTAIPGDERGQHESAVEAIFTAVSEVRELADGYAFRLPPESAMLRSLAEFIANERLCCPFLGFAVELEPQSTALWLSLTGGADVKQFLQGDISRLLKQPVAEAAGLR